MTKSEAIMVFERLKTKYERNPDWGLYDGALCRSDIKEIIDAYIALRGSIDVVGLLDLDLRFQ